MTKFFLSTLCVLLFCYGNVYAFNKHSYFDSALITNITFKITDSALLKEDGGNYKLKFYFFDSAGISHDIIILPGNKAIHITAPTLFIQRDLYATPYLLYPGDKVSIKGDGLGGLIFFTGDKVRDKELHFFNILSDLTGSFLHAEQAEIMHRVNNLSQIKALEKDIFTVKTKRLAIADSLAANHLTGKLFYTIARTAINNMALQDTLLLYLRHIDTLTKYNIFKPVISAKLKLLRLNVREAGNHYYLANCDIISNIALFNKGYCLYKDSSEFLRKVNFIQSAFAGKARHKLLLYALHLYQSAGGSIPSSQIAMLQRIFPASLFTSGNIWQPNTDSSFLIQDNVLLINKHTIVPLKTVINDFKGKLILIDFWASWCGPCRKELPHSLQLRQHYAGKDIAFLYLSIDDDVFNWVKANTDSKIGNQNSFLLLDVNNTFIQYKYKIDTIPRYFLISKTGAIINAYAPRPGDPELEALIDKNL